MTTYYSDRFNSNSGAADSRKHHHWSGYTDTASFTLPGAALTTGDVVKMIPVQAGVKVKDVILTIPDCDTGTSAAVTVGDSDGTPDADRYITATSAQTTSIARMNNIAGHNYEFAADGSIDLVFSTAAQTGITTSVFVMTVVFGGDDDL